MSRTEADPYNAACREAQKIVEGVIASILEGIKAGEVDEDTLSDRIHEEVDNALIYRTSDQWVCAYGLPDDDDAIESGLCTPSNFSEALAAQAYCNLAAAVHEHDFDNALKVAADLAEENTPEEPREEVTPCRPKLPRADVTNFDTVRKAWDMLGLCAETDALNKLTPTELFNVCLMIRCSDFDVYPDMLTPKEVDMAKRLQSINKSLHKRFLKGEI